MPTIGKLADSLAKSPRYRRPLFSSVVGYTFSFYRRGVRNVRGSKTGEKLAITRFNATTLIFKQQIAKHDLILINVRTLNI